MCSFDVGSSWTVIVIGYSNLLTRPMDQGRNITNARNAQPHYRPTKEWRRWGKGQGWGTQSIYTVERKYTKICRSTTIYWTVRMLIQKNCTEVVFGRGDKQENLKSRRTYPESERFKYLRSHFHISELNLNKEQLKPKLHFGRVFVVERHTLSE